MSSTRRERDRDLRIQLSFSAAQLGSQLGVVRIQPFRHLRSGLLPSVSQKEAAQLAARGETLVAVRIARLSEPWENFSMFLSLGVWRTSPAFSLFAILMASFLALCC